MTVVAYMDTSALVKLVRSEQETPALRDWLSGPATPDVFVSSALARVELLRAVRRVDAELAASAGAVLGAMHLLAVGEAVLGRAAEISPPSVRSLDAVHLASAEALGSSLSALVVYDRRLVDAAEGLGLPVVSPGL
jgi:predicted nucleic acid-binding protein